MKKESKVVIPPIVEGEDFLTGYKKEKTKKKTEPKKETSKKSKK